MLVWDDLRFLLAVRRRGSHAGAGRALGVDSTTVGRRLASLEGALGARLFDRTPAGLAPTEAGERLLARAERIEAEVLAAERDLTGADARLDGKLRITTGDGLAAYVIAPALVGFRRDHPGVDLELYGDNRALDLARREADVAVRFFRPREPSLVARRLGALEYGIFAGEGYLGRRPAPRSARDLAGHDWLGYGDSLRSTPQEVWMRRHAQGARRVLRTSTTTALVAACAAGLGLATLPLSFASGDARLQRVLPRAHVPGREAWAVTHQDLQKSARVRAVMSWLAGLFAA